VTEPEPFQTFGCYVKQTRGRRMRDGTVQPVEVEVHPDPRCQELLEQIREAEAVQAPDRVRPIYNERDFVLLNELVLDVTYDRIVTHKELVMDGNRFEQAAARAAAIPLSATEMNRCFREFWPTVKSAEHARERTPISQIIILFGKRGFFPARYRRLGQRCPSRAIIRADAGDPRAALESVVGPVTWFEMDEPVRAEMVATSAMPKSDEPDEDETDEDEPEIAEPDPEWEMDPEFDIDLVDPDADDPDPDGEPEFDPDFDEPEPEPPEPAAQAPQSEVDPPAADPVEDLDQLQRIVASAGRLADLSARLDYARLPHFWGDAMDVLREQKWRARMAALHEMPVAAGGRR
jgi:hypothetical protein